MTINTDLLIDDVRLNLASIQYDVIDDVTIKAALVDSYAYMQMIINEEIQRECDVRACLIRYATYNSYLLYTMYANGESSLPETAGLILSTLLMKAHACLSMLSEVPLNEDLSIKESSYPTPVGIGLTSSSVL